jgi:hypothetical protein
MVRAGRDEALLGEPGDLEDLEEVGGGQAERAHGMDTGRWTLSFP